MEIKIVCPCGTKFKFDVEPINGASPGPVHCPSCGKDSTEATNAIIQKNLAPATPPPVPAAAIHVHAAPAVAAPAAAPAASDGPKISIPAVRIPGAAPVRVSSPAPATPPQPPPAASAPVAAAPAPAAMAPAPAPIAATPPPPPPTPAPAPAASSAPAPAAGGGAISPKMAFMPVPTSGTALSVSGQHGKKEEPKAEAPVAAVATATATPPPVAAPAHAHPASVRAAQAMPPRPPSGGGNFGMGIVGAIIGSIVVAMGWYFLAVNAWPARILAWLPGIGAGFLALLLAKQPSRKLGIATAVIAAVVILITQFAVISGVNDRVLSTLVSESYDQRMALSKRAASAKTDSEFRQIMIEDADTFVDALQNAVDAVKNEQAGSADGSDPAVANYKKTKLPALLKFSKGEPSRAKWEEKARAKYIEQGGNLYEVSGLKLGFMIFWIFSGISSAFKIASGKKA